MRHHWNSHQQKGYSSCQNTLSEMTHSSKAVAVGVLPRGAINNPHSQLIPEYSYFCNSFVSSQSCSFPQISQQPPTFKAPCDLHNTSGPGVGTSFIANLPGGATSSGTYDICSHNISSIYTKRNQKQHILAANAASNPSELHSQFLQNSQQKLNSSNSSLYNNQQAGAEAPSLPNSNAMLHQSYQACHDYNRAASIANLTGVSAYQNTNKMQQCGGSHGYLRGHSFQGTTGAAEDGVSVVGEDGSDRHEKAICLNNQAIVNQHQTSNSSEFFSEIDKCAILMPKFERGGYVGEDPRRNEQRRLYAVSQINRRLVEEFEIIDLPPLDRLDNALDSPPVELPDTQRMCTKLDGAKILWKTPLERLNHWMLFKRQSIEEEGWVDETKILLLMGLPKLSKEYIYRLVWQLYCNSVESDGGFVMCDDEKFPLTSEDRSIVPFGKEAIQKNSLDMHKTLLRNELGIEAIEILFGDEDKAINSLPNLYPQISVTHLPPSIAASFIHPSSPTGMALIEFNSEAAAMDFWCTYSMGYAQAYGHTLKASPDIGGVRIYTEALACCFNPDSARTEYSGYYNQSQPASSGSTAASPLPQGNQYDCSTNPSRRGATLTEIFGDAKLSEGGHFTFFCPYVEEDDVPVLSSKLNGLGVQCRWSLVNHMAEMIVLNEAQFLSLIAYKKTYLNPSRVPVVVLMLKIAGYYFPVVSANRPAFGAQKSSPSSVSGHRIAFSHEKTSVTFSSLPNIGKDICNVSSPDPCCSLSVVKFTAGHIPGPSLTAVNSLCVSSSSTSSLTQQSQHPQSEHAVLPVANAVVRPAAKSRSVFIRRDKNGTVTQSSLLSIKRNQHPSSVTSSSGPSSANVAATGSATGATASNCAINNAASTLKKGTAGWGACEDTKNHRNCNTFVKDGKSYISSAEGLQFAAAKSAFRGSLRRTGAPTGPTAKTTENKAKARGARNLVPSTENEDESDSGKSLKSVSGSESSDNESNSGSRSDSSTDDDEDDDTASQEAETSFNNKAIAFTEVTRGSTTKKNMDEFPGRNTENFHLTEEIRRSNRSAEEMSNTVRPNVRNQDTVYTSCVATTKGAGSAKETEVTTHDVNSKKKQSITLGGKVIQKFGQSAENSGENTSVISNYSEKKSAVGPSKNVPPKRTAGNILRGTPKKSRRKSSYIDTAYARRSGRLRQEGSEELLQLDISKRDKVKAVPQNLPS